MKKLVYFLMFGLAFTASQAAYGNTVAEVTAGMTMVGITTEGSSDKHKDPCFRGAKGTSLVPGSGPRRVIGINARNNEDPTGKKMELDAAVAIRVLEANPHLQEAHAKGQVLLLAGCDEDEGEFGREGLECINGQCEGDE